jgi:hypothetical protein
VSNELEPIVDEVDQAWERFADGSETNSARQTANPLEVLAAALAGAAALAMLAAFVETFSFDGRRSVIVPSSPRSTARPS